MGYISTALQAAGSRARCSGDDAARGGARTGEHAGLGDIVAIDEGAGLQHIRAGLGVDHAAVQRHRQVHVVARQERRLDVITHIRHAAQAHLRDAAQFVRTEGLHQRFDVDLRGQCGSGGQAGQRDSDQHFFHARSFGVLPLVEVGLKQRTFALRRI